jgi:hypothetical protein
MDTKRQFSTGTSPLAIRMIPYRNSAPQAIRRSSCSGHNPYNCRRMISLDRRGLPEANHANLARVRPEEIHAKPMKDLPAEAKR